ncbi:rod shape-determining protein MreD [Dysgonomonas sp. 25]|uniref:rod shape-determining protein MreD n=1 Tax=Dysgonomonas sp. 25 TaxID=2302933 RepID=UPI0013D0631C|nr:rod shape-determining protein MreD [Dysgonomonas sp. 25]NDV67538.1 rod shape-determining protein MreD [Dysgonomonas sp. 25]
MQRDSIVKYALMFVILVLLQVLIFNRISLYAYATPYLYIYLIIKLPVGIQRNITLLVAFVLGFTIDIFSNTPGVNAAATTLAAFFRRPIQSVMFTLDDYEEKVPCLSLLGWTFVKYVLLMVLIHHTALILLESFTLFNIEMQLLRILFSFILTSILIFILEGFSVQKRKK